MKKVLATGIAALMLMCGCCSVNGGCGDNPQPIVSPTNITDTVQDVGDPVLPSYVPWWAKEKRSVTQP